MGRKQTPDKIIHHENTNMQSQACLPSVTYKLMEVRGCFQSIRSVGLGSRVRMHLLGQLIKAGLDFRFRGINLYV